MAITYADLFAHGVYDAFKSGASLFSIARGLREAGFTFSDKSLRDARDFFLSNDIDNVMNYPRDEPIPPEHFTVSSRVPCGEYGIALGFSGYNQDDKSAIEGRTFHIVSNFTTVNDFLDSYGDQIKEDALGDSDIVIDEFSYIELYEGEC